MFNAEDEAIFQRVVNLRDTGSYSDALKALAPLSKCYPDHTGLLVFQGHLYWESGDLNSAVRSFARATELRPTMETASLGLYHCLRLQGKRIEALEEAKRFLSVADCQDYRN